MARPVLIVHSNLPIIQILCSHLSSQFQVILSDYSNDYDLFNSKLVLFVVKPHIYKMQRMLNDRYIGMLLHSLEVLNFVSLRRSF